MMYPNPYDLAKGTYNSFYIGSKGFQTYLYHRNELVLRPLFLYKKKITKIIGVYNCGYKK